jgi:hypothetical protein
MQMRLRHVATGALLKSLNHSYQHPGSSGQQMVVASALKNLDTLWIIKGSHESGDRYPAGEAVKHNDIIRLEHVATHKNLHSHNHPSPLTAQQEVTAYGEAGHGDSKDNWIADLDLAGPWRLDGQVRLAHQQTQKVLHSHPGGHVHNVYTAGEQEVTCLEKGDANDLWVCAIEDQLPEEQRLAVPRIGHKRWVEYLSILGSIASITGWTLVTLKQTLQSVQFLDVIAYLFSSTLVLGALLILTSVVVRFYRIQTFNPRSRIWQIGFWMIIATLYMLTLLISWRISIHAANSLIIPLLKWVFAMP